MKQQLEKIRQEALDALGAVKSADELDALRVRFLGKKGELTGVLKMMGKLSAEERPVMGQVANNVRAAIEEQLEITRASLKEKALEAKLRAEAVDVTIPGDPVRLGHRHPMNIALDEAKELFIGGDTPYIIARGRKGGSNVAASIVNALLYQMVHREGF